MFLKLVLEAEHLQVFADVAECRAIYLLPEYEPETILLKENLVMQHKMITMTTSDRLSFPKMATSIYRSHPTYSSYKVTDIFLTEGWAQFTLPLNLGRNL